MSVTLVSVPAQIIGAAGADAWLSFLPPALLILLSLWLLSRAGARFPEQDLFEAMVSRRAVVGRILVVLYALFYLLILARDIRMFVDFTNIVLIPDTPLTVIAILTAIALIQIAIGGVEVTARMTDLFITLLFLLAFVVPIVVVKDFEWKYLQPFLENGLKDPLAGSWYAVAYIGEIIAFPMLFPARTYRYRTWVYGLFSGVGTLELLIVLNLLVLGPYLSSICMYPNLEMVRQIRVTDFLDRFDLPIATVWMCSMLVRNAISLYIICHGIKRAFPKVSAQQIIPPVGLLATVLSFWLFQNLIQHHHFNHTYPVIALVFEVAIPFLIFLVMRPKKEQRAQVEEKQAS